MNNKAIVVSLLLNTCIATHVHANTLDNNYFYFGSKFNILQPNYINKKSDLFNFKNLYNNYWSHSLYGFLIGYQNNSYFGFEISYNDPFINQEKINNIFKQEKNFRLEKNYLSSIKKVEDKESEEEEKINQIQMQQINESQTSYVNFSNSNPHNSKLLSIRNNNIQKAYGQSEYTSSRTNANRNSKIHDKINIMYPQKNLEIATKISIPVLNSIDIYSRLGCSLNLNQNLLKIRNSDTHYLFKDNIFPLISFGLQYKINKNFYSRIEFEKKITYYSNSKSRNLNSINFNFIWNFQDIFSNNSYHNPLSLKYSNQLKNFTFKKDL
ncbi:Outer membrane protein A [Buchnera aphidicola (Chaitophorus sp. 3695)]|uniref:hypothetical protein n=1 Tax=Buchnera aphidicola TaxID=9 RepID=UPI003463ED40